MSRRSCTEAKCCVSKACAAFEPSVVAKCQTDVSGAPASDDPTYKDFHTGYVAADGDQALVGATGTFCEPTGKPACSSNSDPAAILSSGKPFATLWSEAVAAQGSNSNSYSLAPCTKVNGSWSRRH